jgi:hypothetical protein
MEYWINKINGGGFTIIVDTYFLFLAIEYTVYATRRYLTTLTDPGTPQKFSKDAAATTIVNDPDIQFHWSLLTCNHEQTVAAELLSKLTIRGFSMAAAFMEEYKHTHIVLNEKLRKLYARNSRRLTIQ